MNKFVRYSQLTNKIPGLDLKNPTIDFSDKQNFFKKVSGQTLEFRQFSNYLDQNQANIVLLLLLKFKKYNPKLFFEFSKDLYRPIKKISFVFGDGAIAYRRTYDLSNFNTRNINSMSQHACSNIKKAQVGNALKQFLKGVKMGLRISLEEAAVESKTSERIISRISKAIENDAEIIRNFDEIADSIKPEMIQAGIAKAIKFNKNTNDKYIIDSIKSYVRDLKILTPSEKEEFALLTILDTLLPNNKAMAEQITDVIKDRRFTMPYSNAYKYPDSEEGRLIINDMIEFARNNNPRDISIWKSYHYKPTIQSDIPRASQIPQTTEDAIQASSSALQKSSRWQKIGHGTWVVIQAPYLLGRAIIRNISNIVYTALAAVITLAVLKYAFPDWSIWGNATKAKEAISGAKVTTEAQKIPQPSAANQAPLPDNLHLNPIGEMPHNTPPMTGKIGEGVFSKPSPNPVTGVPPAKIPNRPVPKLKNPKNKPASTNGSDMGQQALDAFMKS
jgi:hypothetical protein